MTKQITFADTFEIEFYEDELNTLLEDVLQLKASECFISDESSFKDFAMCGEYDGNDAGWEPWLIKKCKMRFNVTVTADMLLVDACKLIRVYGIRGTGLN